ncbi:DgyrCDS4931 [Dimorphilus gyrociliatus]|nr:DgyrCDS4931 [Dimorphilus gyrociliatus]
MFRLKRSYIFGVLGTSSLGLGVYLLSKRTKKSKRILIENDLQEKKMDKMAEKYEMIASQVFFRHGSRTPLNRELPVGEPGFDSKTLLQSVPHTEVPFFIRDLDGGPRPISNIERKYELRKFEGGTHAGQLTKIGREQGFRLGQRLKRKYVDIWKIIPEQFNPQLVYMRSTNINRCIDTLQCVAAGIWGKNLEKPMEFFVAPGKDEFLYPASHRCKSLKGIETLGIVGLKEVEGLTKLENLLKDKFKLETDMPIFACFDNIQCKKGNDIPIFDWLEDIKDEMDEAVVKTMNKIRVPSPEYKTQSIKLGIGRVFDTILNNFEKLDKKLFLYSAHDSTLSTMLSGLDSLSTKWPPFAADISFDLLRDKETGSKIVCLSYCERVIKILPYKEFADLANR